MNRFKILKEIPSGFYWILETVATIDGFRTRVVDGKHASEEDARCYLDAQMERANSGTVEKT